MAEHGAIVASMVLMRSVQHLFHSVHLTHYLQMRFRRLKPIRVLAFLALSPYILFTSIVRHVRARNHWPKPRTVPHDLAIATIAKGESRYIAEWIEYHMLLGATKFYVFDNGVTDGLRDALDAKIMAGVVEYRALPGIGMQPFAIHSALHKARREAKYLAVIDADEFIVSTQGSIVEAVDAVIAKHPRAAAVALNWRCFGSGHHVARPPGLVLENYLIRAQDDHVPNRMVKTICVPELTAYFDTVHSATCLGKWMCIDEQGTEISGPKTARTGSYKTLFIHHYVCKSREDALEKLNRGRGNGLKRDWSWFLERDRNDVFDDRMLPFAAELRSRGIVGSIASSQAVRPGGTDAPMDSRAPSNSRP